MRRTITALYPLTGVLQNPILTANAMSVFNLFVVTNWLRLCGFRPRQETRIRGPKPPSAW